MASTYVLSYRDVAHLLSEINLAELFVRVGDEIEAIYKDPSLRPVQRMGWSKPPDAREIMACTAADVSCIKRISSVPAANGSPTVTGSLMLTDIGSEQELLVCDATFLTPLRTAAASGVIMRKAVPSAASLGVAGAGLEGIAHALALASMMEALRVICLHDIDRDQATKAAGELESLLTRDRVGHEVTVEVCEAESELYQCDALVTATFAESGQEVLTAPESVKDGTFIAAVGADLARKRELPDQLYERAKFVADDLRQCLEDGELQYAKSLCSAPEDEASVTDHRGSLGGGRILGASDFLSKPDAFLNRAEPITIYDSAGFSGQDLAMARVLIEVLEESDWQRQPWNPPAGSLLDLLDCAPPSPDSV